MESVQGSHSSYLRALATSECCGTAVEAAAGQDGDTGALTALVSSDSDGYFQTQAK